jgi:hypothetical protein
MPAATRHRSRACSWNAVCDHPRMSDGEPLVRLEFDNRTRTLTLHLPADTAGWSPEKVAAMVDEIVAARSEWIAKGYSIAYSTLTE